MNCLRAMAGIATTCGTSAGCGDTAWFPARFGAAFALSWRAPACFRPVCAENCNTPSSGWARTSSPSTWIASTARSRRRNRPRLPRFPGGASPYANFLQLLAGARRRLSARMLFADQKTYLVELLMKQDQMSMATSIESRVPFLDHPFVEFSTRVPSRLKLRGGEGKYIVKKAVEDLLPHEIVYRRKMGFPTPLRQWLGDPRAEAMFRYLGMKDGFLAGYLDVTQVNALIERHRSGRYESTDRLWRLLNLQIWGEIFLSGRDRVEEICARVLEPVR